MDVSSRVPATRTKGGYLPTPISQKSMPMFLKAPVPIVPVQDKVEWKKKDIKMVGEHAVFTMEFFPF